MFGRKKAITPEERREIPFAEINEQVNPDYAMGNFRLVALIDL